MSTLFERLGSREAVEAAVDNFYPKVLADDRVKDFFEDADMTRQAGKQKAFLTFAFGGPNNYDGQNMRDGHAHLLAKGLNDSHVDAIIEILAGTLKEMGVADELIAEVGAVAESVRNDILGR